MKRIHVTDLHMFNSVSEAYGFWKDMTSYDEKSNTMKFMNTSGEEYHKFTIAQDIVHDNIHLLSKQQNS